MLEHNYLMYLDVVNHRKGLDSTDNYLRPTIKKSLTHWRFNYYVITLNGTLPWVTIKVVQRGVLARYLSQSYCSRWRYFSTCLPRPHWDRLKVEFNACNGPFDDMFIFGQSFGPCSVMGDHL